MTKPNLVLVRECAPDFDLPTLREVGGEPRIRDIDLGKQLGFTKVQKIRALIRRNEVELKEYGPISAAVAETTDPDRRDRPGNGFWLNEGQALVICALSRTPPVAQVRRALIEGFIAYRRCRLHSESGVMRALAHQIEVDIDALAELSGRIDATRASLNATFAAYAAGKAVRL